MLRSFPRRRLSSLAAGLVAVLGALGATVAVPAGIPVAGATTPALSAPVITAPASATTSPISTVTVSGTAKGATPTVVAVVVTVHNATKTTTGDWTALAGVGSTATGKWSVPISLLQGTWHLRALEIDTQGDASPASTTVTVSVASDSAVVNGGFETPPENGGAPVLPNLPGWTPTVAGSSTTTKCPPGSPGGTGTTKQYHPTATPTNGIEIQAPDIYGVGAQTGGTPSASTGGTRGQYLTLASNCIGGVVQHVATIPGLQYTLTFYYRARPFRPAKEMVLTAEWNGVHITPVLQGQTTSTPIQLSLYNGLYTKSASGGLHKTHWTKATYRVTAASTTSTLQFNDAYKTTPTVSVGPFLDDVSLVPTYARAPPNTRWQTAATIGDPTATGSLTYAGEQLWYKFAINPGEHVSAVLTNVAANYQLSMFSTIAGLAKSLSTATTALSISELEAQNPANTDLPASFANARYYNGRYYNGRYYNGRYYNGRYYNGRYYNGEFADGRYYNGQFSNARYYNGRYYNGGHGLTAVGTQAVADSLVGFSTQQGAVNKTVTADTYNNTGFFYVEVSGTNGAFAPTEPFTLTVTKTGTTCAGTVKTFFGTDGYSTTTAAPPVNDTNAASYTTIIVADSETMPAAKNGYVGTTTPVYPALQSLAAATNGHVVDVGTSTWVRAQTQQALTNPTCPYAVNLEADAIQRVVNTYRVGPTSVKNVVVVGDDNVIPFFRDPDQEQVEPEVTYATTVPLASNTQAAAALAKNFFLTDDQYGSKISLTINGSTLPVQTAAVGRLVETPTDIVKAITTYLTPTATHKVIAPTSTLSAGYTFMAAGAQQIVTALSAEGVASATNASLITPETVPASTAKSWSATALLGKLTGKAHQLVFIGAHFNANALLAANRSSTLTTRTFATKIQTMVKGSLVLSAGCHAGYTIDPANTLTYAFRLAWPQAVTEAGGTLVAGTGFQYGDSNYVAASDQIYVDLVKQLGYGSTTNPASIGTSLLQTEWRYLAGLDTLNGLDQKSLLQVTLYGLPMEGVKMPSPTTAPGNTSSLVSSTTPVGSNTPGSGFGLSEAPLALSGSQLQATKTTVTATGKTYAYDQGKGGVMADPGAAVLPVEIDNVNVKTLTLRGIGFTGGSYTDTTVPLPLTGDPVTQTSAPLQPFTSPVYYPQKMWNPNYFGDIHTGADTELGVTPLQYVSNATNPASTATLRQFTSMRFKLFYVPNGTTAQNKGAALAASPSITAVSATVSGTSVTVTATVAQNASGIQEVWTTYTDPGASSGWSSKDLTETPGDPTRWSLTFADPSASASDFMVQAVNGAGDVSLDDNQGAFFTTVAGSNPASPPTPTPYRLSLTAGDGSGTYGTAVTLHATLTPTSAGTAKHQPISFSIGSTSALAFTNTTGTASATIGLSGLPPGTYTATASFTGGTSAAAASTSKSFTVEPATTSLSLTGPTTLLTGPTTGVTATLLAGGKPLAGETVHFALFGPTQKVLATSVGTTTRNGRAVAGPLEPPPGVVGTGFDVKAYFSTTQTPTVGALLDDAVVGYVAAAPASLPVKLRDATQTTLSPNVAVATFGEKVVLSASVAPSGTSSPTWPTPASIPSPTVPTGSVTFYDGTTNIGTAPLTYNAGLETASITLSGGLPGGTNHLSVRFPGSAVIASSTGKATLHVGFTETLAGTVSAPLTIGKGQAVLVTGTVNAPVTVKAGGALEVRGGTVTGPIRATGAIGFSLCGATVGGPVSVTDSTGFVFVGGGAGTGCARTTVTGPLSLSKNTSGVEVANSTIKAPVSVTDNKGSGPVVVNDQYVGPEIAGNTITGPLSCNRNTPTPTDAGMPNTAPNRRGQCATPANF